MFRLIVLLLSVLALNTQALAGVMRAPVRDQVQAMTMHKAGVQAQVSTDDAMDCCDPDTNKAPCGRDKDGTCLCKLGQNCQNPQLPDSISTLSVFIPTTQLMPSTQGTTLLLSHRASRMLRPPIR